MGNLCLIIDIMAERTNQVPIKKFVRKKDKQNTIVNIESENQIQEKLKQKEALQTEEMLKAPEKELQELRKVVSAPANLEWGDIANEDLIDNVVYDIDKETLANVLINNDDEGILLLNESDEKIKDYEEILCEEK